jgi:cyclase
LLWKNLGLVKGLGFDSWRRVGTVMPALKVYNTRDVDELILLDIAATLEERHVDYAELEELAAECFVPLTVGGGVRSIDDIRNLLKAGADKVCINSAAYSNPEIIREGADRFGSQCIVASIDARKTSKGAYECFSHAGTRATGKTPGEWAKELESLGAGEILITSIELDGTMNGYDLDLVRSATEAVSIPVIASGGAGSYEDVERVIVEAGASAAAAGSMFQFTQRTPMEAKTYLAEKGIPVRNTSVCHGFRQPA